MSTHVTILYDNHSVITGGLTGWGFSCLVDRDGHRLLFDTGWDGDRLLYNADHLGVDLSSIDSIFISHEHWDHLGGLVAVLGYVTPSSVYVPASLSRRFVGELSAKARVVEVSTQQPVGPGLISTGELGDGLKEQSLLVEVQGGVAVVTGCAHPGLDNIIRAARCYQPVRAVIGGFHGFGDLHQLESIGVIVPCHCTAYKERILKRFTEAAVPCGVGVVIELD